MKLLTKNFKLGNLYFKVIVLALSIFAISIRLLMILRGHNYDMDSFFQVGNLVANGNSPWSTNRYNYSPFGAQFFGLIGAISGDNFLLFRVIYVSCLSFLDLLLALILLKVVGFAGFFIYLISPISIVLTGYHNQFDNVALFFGLLSVLSDEKYYSRLGRKYQKLFLLNYRGYSLSKFAFLTLSILIKHDLIIFVLWNFFREKSIKLKFINGVLPIIFFLVSFVPYYNFWDQIKANVINYRSFNNAPLLHFLVPNQYLSGSLPFVFFILSILLIGWFVRKTEDDLIHFAIFLSTLFLFSSAIANQYLIIPLLAMAIFKSAYSVQFLFFASIFLLGNGNGLHIKFIIDSYPAVVGFQYQLLVVAFFPYYLSLLFRAKNTSASDLLNIQKGDSRKSFHSKS
jgi:hypothetical protein